MERKRRLLLLRANWHDDCMSSIIPARTASADVEFGSEDVDELAFTLVAPLGAEDDGHYTSNKIRSASYSTGSGIVDEQEEGIPLIAFNPPWTTYGSLSVCTRNVRSYTLLTRQSRSN